MASTSAAPSRGREAALAALAADLRRIFGVRLRSLVAYGAGRPASGAPLHTLALADTVTFADLTACAPLADVWRRAGLAVPLILSTAEFTRTLDVFPVEYGAILDDYTVVEGDDLLGGLAIAESDLRRACELQAKSLLIHLREGFLESGRDPHAVAELVAASASAFRSLLVNLARLQGRERVGDDDALAVATARMCGVPADLTRDILRFGRAHTVAIDATALLARYIDGVERLWAYVDGWRPR